MHIKEKKFFWHFFEKNSIFFWHFSQVSSNLLGLARGAKNAKKSKNREKSLKQPRNQYWVQYEPQSSTMTSRTFQNGIFGLFGYPPIYPNYDFGPYIYIGGPDKIWSKILKFSHRHLQSSTDLVLRGICLAHEYCKYPRDKGHNSSGSISPKFLRFSAILRNV